MKTDKHFNFKIQPLNECIEFFSSTINFESLDNVRRDYYDAFCQR